jgi:hypothetical protein
MAPNIFEIINGNIVALSEDLVLMHKKIDEIHAVLYPQQSEKPKAAGDPLDD